MKTKSLKTIGIIVIVLSIIGIAISFQMDFSHIPLSTPVNLTDVEIKLEKTACFGPCPIYSVIIYGDGTVIYDGIQFVDNVGKSTHQIPKEHVNDLVELIYELNYFSLKDRYATNWTDDSTVITSVKINNEQKTVANYGHFGPDRLHEIEKKIDDLTNFIPFLEKNDDDNDLSVKKLDEQPVEHFCANIGFDKYPDNLFAEFLENPYTQDVTFLNFTDDDLKQIPEFYELILESHQIDYPLNDHVRFTVSPDEHNMIINYLEQRTYSEFNKNGETLLHQIGTRDIDGHYRIPQILIDDKLYRTNGLKSNQVFSDRDVHMNIEYSGTLEDAKQRLLKNTNPNRANLIYFEVTEDDKMTLALIFDAINQIQKSKDKIHMSEDVGSVIQNQSQDFFIEQNKIQFNSNSTNYTKFFILNETMYETSFTVC